MKNGFCIILTFILCTVSLNCHALETSAKAAIVIEAEQGSVIYEKNSSQRLTMASTTKIMTAICAIEEGNPEQKVKIAPEAVGVEGSSIYLKHGEELTLKELVYGLMLNSGNDAAVAIACAVSGDVKSFAQLMNKKAKEIGVKNTQFKNPNGLDEEGHYTTAADLAAITAYGLKNDDFRKIVSTYQTTITGNEEAPKRFLTNHNKLLKRYEGCIGVKTGFTKKSGRCLVSAAERDGVTLVAVTLSAPDDWTDHTNMLNYGFERVHSKTMAEKGEPLTELIVKNGVKDSVDILCESDFSVAAVDGKRYVTRFKSPGSVDAPVEKGETVGIVEMYMDDKLIGTVPAVTADSVPIDDTRSIGLSVMHLLHEFTDFDKPLHIDR
ncbi:MAG: D-alanyl-D-alanine carboxypeptidase [Clostridia bacterium]|nr:D-alanyl-D-alanine carboxypeptidase [Clostridia bacterium]